MYSLPMPDGDPCVGEVWSLQEEGGPEGLLLSISETAIQCVSHKGQKRTTPRQRWGEVWQFVREGSTPRACFVCSEDAFLRTWLVRETERTVIAAFCGDHFPSGTHLYFPGEDVSNLTPFNDGGRCPTCREQTEPVSHHPIADRRHTLLWRCRSCFSEWLILTCQGPLDDFFSESFRSLRGLLGQTPLRVHAGGLAYRNLLRSGEAESFIVIQDSHLNSNEVLVFLREGRRYPNLSSVWRLSGSHPSSGLGRVIVLEALGDFVTVLPSDERDGHDAVSVPLATFWRDYLPVNDNPPETRLLEALPPAGTFWRHLDEDSKVVQVLSVARDVNSTISFRGEPPSRGSLALQQFRTLYEMIATPLQRPYWYYEGRIVTFDRDADGRYRMLDIGTKKVLRIESSTLTILSQCRDVLTTDIPHEDWLDEAKEPLVTVSRLSVLIPRHPVFMVLRYLLKEGEDVVLPLEELQRVYTPYPLEAGLLFTHKADRLIFRLSEVSKVEQRAVITNQKTSLGVSFEEILRHYDKVPPNDFWSLLGEE